MENTSKALCDDGSSAKSDGGDCVGRSSSNGGGSSDEFGFVAQAGFAPPTSIPNVDRAAVTDPVRARERLILFTLNIITIAVLALVVPATASSVATQIVTPLVLLVLFDLFIAFLHMTFDNPKLLNHAILGPMAFDFQEHHVVPWKCAVWPAWYQALETVPGSLFFALYSVPLQYYWGISLVSFASWTLFYALFTQYVHRFCHQPPSERRLIMKALALVGLCNNPKTHALHHHTLDQAYAILNGVTNPIVSWLNKNWRDALHPNWIYYLVSYGLMLPWLYRITIAVTI